MTRFMHLRDQLLAETNPTEQCSDLLGAEKAFVICSPSPDEMWASCTESNQDAVTRMLSPAALSFWRGAEVYIGLDFLFPAIRT